jgi:Cys-tRNA(Pro)/Cys-tRNA(Cys) deacylase
MVQDTPVTRRLSELGIEHTLHIHDKPLRSLEQAAAERGLQNEQIVRSLLFRLADHTYILVLVAGPGKVTWSNLRKAVGVRRLTTADNDEGLEITGYPPGAVSPIGLKQPLRILADRGLADQEIISIGAGIKNAGVLLRMDDLLSAIDIELVDVIEGRE